MTALLLNPTSFLALLVAGAVATPVIGLLAARWLPDWRRTAWVFAALGPFALAFWAVHNAVLATVGFDSVWSAIIVAGACAIIGWLAGRWAGGEAATPSTTPTNPEKG
ncbi:hypothetical protein GC173_10175 [bacterium]|nr:hypothetical protein [bacterium]